MEPCEKILELEEDIDKIKEDVQYLMIRDTSTSIQLENLIKRVDKLIETFEKFMEATRKANVWILRLVVAGLIGFVIWYLQNL